MNSQGEHLELYLKINTPSNKDSRQRSLPEHSVASQEPVHLQYSTLGNLEHLTQANLCRIFLIDLQMPPWRRPKTHKRPDENVSSLQRQGDTRDWRQQGTDPEFLTSTFMGSQGWRDWRIMESQIRHVPGLNSGQESVISMCLRVWWGSRSSSDSWQLWTKLRWNPNARLGFLAQTKNVLCLRGHF